MTTCTRPRRPRLPTRLPRMELDIELTRIELGYAAAMAMEIEHIRPDLIRHRAEIAVAIARHRQARAAATLADIYGKQPVVYLLHFDRRRYQHAAQHWTENLAARLARHAVGDGARLLAVVHQAGISWQLARVWPGPRERERQLKRQGGASRHCPLCKRLQLAAGGPVKIERGQS